MASLINDYTTCSTAMSAVVKGATISGFILAAGTLFGINFINGNSAANPTLNMNNTGAIALFSGISPTGNLPANFKALIQYDGTNYNILNYQVSNSSILVNGILKGDGLGNISAAIPNTDYSTPYALSSGLAAKTAAQMQMTGYTVPTSTSAILPTDTINTAIGKLEGRLNNGNQKTYYVSNTGNDNADGLSTSTPWKTVAKVNSFSPQPGDIICFKSGDVWREQLKPKGGSAGSYVTYTKYGTGSLPAFQQSISAVNTANWVNVGTNLWKNSTWFNDPLAYKSDIGNIIVTNEVCGWKRFSLASLTQQLDYYCDPSDRTVTMYSIANPASLYNMIELAFGRSPILDASYIPYKTLDSLELRYSGLHGIDAYGQWQGAGTCSFIRVTNCTIHHIGGTAPNLPGSTVRLGNAIQFWDNTHDCLVDSNNIYQIYDAGVTNQGSSVDAQQYNITYSNNTIDACEMSFELFLNGSNSSMRDITFSGNTCTNAGANWSNVQRPDPHACHVIFWSFTSKNNITIINNVFDAASNYLIFLSRVAHLVDTAWDYNTYVQPSASSYLMQSYDTSENLTMANYLIWVNTYNLDHHSTFNGLSPT